MGVGGVRGGGGKGRAGGAKGGVGKASGSGFSGRVEGAGGAGKAEGLVGPSGAAGSGNVGGAAAAGPVDPVTAQALELAKQLKSGQISSKEEATKKLVADILKEKLRMQSKALTSKIADALQDDPRLNQALERLWSKG